MERGCLETRRESGLDGSQIYTELGGDKGGHSLQLIRNPPAL